MKPTILEKNWVLPSIAEGRLPWIIKVVYALIDPRKPTIPRYIGATEHLATRLTKHISQAKQQSKTYKDIWINQLLAEGNKPTTLVLGESTPVYNEAFYIKLYKSQGIILLNKTEDGHKWGKRISAGEDAKIREFLGLDYVQYHFNF